MKLLITLWVLALGLVTVGSCQAGLFFGPNTRIVTTHHYYGGVPATSVYVGSTYVGPTYVAVPVGAVGVVGVRTHPHKAAHHAHKAAKHTGKAQYHGTMTDYYSNN